MGAQKWLTCLADNAVARLIQALLFGAEAHDSTLESTGLTEATPCADILNATLSYLEGIRMDWNSCLPSSIVPKV